MLRRGASSVDLRDNIDCVEAGLNQSRACAMSNAVIGVFNSLDPTIPHNAGGFRRITILLRENCVVGIPNSPLHARLLRPMSATDWSMLLKLLLRKSATGSAWPKADWGWDQAMQ